MDRSLAVKLTGSMVEHVPVSFNFDKLCDLLRSTWALPIHTHLDTTFEYSKITEDKYTCFYPIGILRNDLMTYIPKRFRFFKTKNFDLFYYIDDIQSKENLVTMMQDTRIKNKSNIYSMLGIIENVTFDDNVSADKTSIKPQLIIPGYENNWEVLQWEDSQVRQYVNKYSHLG